MAAQIATLRCLTELRTSPRGQPSLNPDCEGVGRLLVEYLLKFRPAD